MDNYIQKLYMLFFKPKSFFESVAEEKEYMKILGFYFTFFIIFSLIKFFSVYIQLKTPFVVFLGIISIIQGIISAFLSTVLVHFGVIIVGGKQKYFNTFKPVVYAIVIGIVYATIIQVIVVMPSLFIFNINLGQGLQFFQALPLPLIIVYVIFGISVILHIIYTEIIGLSYFQKLSTGKALFASLVPLFIGLIILLLFVVL